MRSWFRISIVVLGLVMVCLFVWLNHVRAQTGVLSGEVAAVWSHSGLDVNGNPETLASFNLAVAPPGVDISAGQPPATSKVVSVVDAATPETNQYRAQVQDLLLGVTGGEWVLWASANDVAGNRSEWTSTTFSYDNVAPEGITVLVIIRINR